jgi:hypothetical protein
LKKIKPELMGQTADEAGNVRAEIEAELQNIE